MDAGGVRRGARELRELQLRLGALLQARAHVLGGDDPRLAEGGLQGGERPLLRRFAGADTGKTKLEAAEKHGVPVLDEAALEKLLTGEPAGGSEPAEGT
jgi:hypothetical protein